MPKNLHFGGKRVTIKGLASAVTDGKLTRAKGFLGVPAANAAAGASVAFHLEGVWGLTYDDYAGLEATIAVGTLLYWDTTAAKLSIGYANDDYAAVKVVDTDTLTSNGHFLGLLLPQAAPVGQEQS